MFRKIAISAVSALTLAAGAATAETAEIHIHDVAFGFEGPFGKFDQNQLQRGLQVYTEVCSACHGMKYVPIRSLSEAGGPGLTDQQVRDYAEAFTVLDEASNHQLFDQDKGEYRPLKPSDNFPVNNTIGAPDLSLMAKARAGFHGPYGSGLNQLFKGMGGPEYIAAILNGYTETPACAPADFPNYYNSAFAPGGYPDECKIFEETVTEVTNPDGTVTTRTDKVEVGRMAPGSWIQMPPPLMDDQVTFADGSPATVEAMSHDAAAFLMWAAEPKLMARKQMGFVAVLMLTILSVLLYLTNKQLWSRVKVKKTHA
ncbi:cytochrome c1 [Rhodobacter ferrooxidans]|uniref:Cytochrome c1 n=1 Tax=Rhodobacter ferrooxidans TaxID=371731 RepID=C8RWZ0_9RHOB|nr:cytochrome c1 [Rhodobacter sp. SW2]EEW26515.1 cytochrome c1 [Rhodobacter sp. SW2]